jgi:hypothetical protein
MRVQIILFSDPHCTQKYSPKHLIELEYFRFDQVEEAADLWEMTYGRCLLGLANILFHIRRYGGRRTAGSTQVVIH